MTRTTPAANATHAKLRAELLAWLPVIIGLAVLYLPSLYDLFTGIWSSDEQMHGPIVLCVASRHISLGKIHSGVSFYR